MRRVLLREDAGHVLPWLVSRYGQVDQTVWIVQSAKEVGLSSNAHTYCGWLPPPFCGRVSAADVSGCFSSSKQTLARLVSGASS